MKIANVFIGIVEGMVAAAVTANTIAEAKAMMPGAEVIKMTGKTKLFVTIPSKFNPLKKLAISGATKSIKGSLYPQPRVSTIDGKLVFIAPIYINDMPVPDSICIHFPNHMNGNYTVKLC